MGEGVYELLRTPLLRTLTITSSLGMLAGAISAAVQMLFLVNQLDFTPSIIGIVAASGGIGSLAGAILAGNAARLLQAGRTLVLGKLLWIAGTLLLATADLIGNEIAVAGVARALVGLGSTLYFVNQLSLRQAITSVRLLGRVTAARRFVLFGVATVGAFIGGALGESIGLRGNPSGRVRSPCLGTGPASAPNNKAGKNRMNAPSTLHLLRLRQRREVGAVYPYQQGQSTRKQNTGKQPEQTAIAQSGD